MPNDHPPEEDLVMLYYREGGLAKQLQAHLAECPSCRDAYSNLVRVLDACHDLTVPEPQPAFEARMWNRLEPQLQPLGRRRPLWPVLRNPWLVGAAAAAMLVLAFLAGRFTRQPQKAAQIIAITADGRHRVLLMALGDHLERSQMMLTELVNEPDQPADLALERERARNLISENRLYRQTAAESGDPAVAQLLDDLERVLLDLSHGMNTEEVKSRIAAESLLFKLRVVGANLKPSEDIL